MYAEKTGVGSVLSPREMTIPSGSDELISLRSFFINLSLDSCHTRGSAPFSGTGYAIRDARRK